jgi:carbonic anhydrase
MSSKYYSLIIIVAILLLNISCQSIKEKKEVVAEKSRHEWSYSGETSPDHWAELEKNSDCDGSSQSPINIIEDDAVFKAGKNSDLLFHYNPKTIIHNVVNNGHSIQFNFEEGDSITYKGKVYYLKQFHFHEESEHSINGVKFPIEIHFVHANPEYGNTVLSILGEEGKKDETMTFFESFLPINKGEKKKIERAFDFKTVYPPSTIEYFTYTGSLTTPPCTERVNWIIFKKTVILSKDQVEVLKNNMPLNNYRDEQALNGRVVTKNF